MKRTVDVRNAACPGPVIETKKAVENFGPGTIEVITNNAASRENILRYLASRGITASVSGKDDCEIITFDNTVQTGASPSYTISCDNNTAGRSLIISRDRLGDGDEQLGTILIRTFFHTLTETGLKPEKIFFVNGGIRLTTAGSPVIDDLKALAGTGVGIYSCGTCLDYYNLKEKLLVGEVGNMYLLVEILGNGGIFL